MASAMKSSGARKWELRRSGMRIDFGTDLWTDDFSNILGVLN